MTPSDEEKEFVEAALYAVDSGSAGHWPTVAGYLADEVRRLRAQILNLDRWVERVSAKPANAWDQGHESAIDDCPCRKPEARDCVNPYRVSHD